MKIVDCNPRRGWWLVENKAGGSGYVSAAKADSALYFETMVFNVSSSFSC